MTFSGVNHSRGNAGMAIRARCSACGAKLKADDRHAGRTVPCPGCQQPLTLPSGAPSEEFVDPFAAEAEALAAPPKPAAIAPPEVVKRPPPLRPLTPSAAKPPAPATGKTVTSRKPAGQPPTPPAPPPVAEPDFKEEVEASEVAPEVDDSSFPDLSDEDLAGEVLHPQKKKKQLSRVDDDEEPAATRKSKSRPRRALVDLPTAGFEWRQHLHWVLILGLMPLVLSTVFGDSGSVLEQIEQSLENHPEVNAEAVDSADSVHDLALLFPEHRIDGALLSADTYWHWGFALASSLAFLGLFLFMWPGKESRAPTLLITGIATGTVGIMLLLGFQWVAFSTGGVVLRGRGIVVLLFYLVQFIGFSYRCALDGESGFLSSFFGFTFGVGLCEELCKALPVAFYLSGSEKRSLREVCLIGLASGVGFGVSEGITYSAEYYNGIHDIWIYVIRFLSCVSLHSIWAGSVALLMYRNQDYLEWSWEAAFGFVVYYLLVAMVLHGVYDTLLKQDHELLAVLSALVSFGWFQWTLSRASAEAGEF